MVMIHAETNPPRLVVELPGREPFIIWNRNECLKFINETFDAAKLFYGGWNAKA